ncbi:hypothetical protein ACFSR6_16830 [Pedobacter vanadiisoli]|uniref:Phosphodiesterase n=1 Tax=Pedobacter vanadiisoli TaxID=1761975 RepID=A0ABW5MMV5_9SPHI
MEIISHRGYWINAEEKNTDLAFARSFSNQYGTETDIRDYCGELVISHDIANGNSLSIDHFFEIYINNICSGTLALNVKADGLQEVIKNKLTKHGIENYFFFDMSIPDTLNYIKHGLNIYSRQSEYEPTPAFYTECRGIWLDAFVNIWFDANLINSHLSNGKKVALVSPELHKRDYFSFWQMLKDQGFHFKNDIILCTDLPDHAKKFFNENE